MFVFSYDLSQSSLLIIIIGVYIIINKSLIPQIIIMIALYKGRHQKKKNVFFRALPALGGEGGLPIPGFFGRLFLPSNSP